MKRRGICALLLVVVVVAAACVPGFPADAPPPPGREIQVPEGDLWVTVWLPAGWIYFGRATTNVGDPPQVWRVRPDGGRLERLELPSLPDCNRTDYLLRRHALPDGRVGLARHCIAPSPSQDRIDLVAVDPGTGEVEELAPSDR